MSLNRYLLGTSRYRVVTTVVVAQRQSGEHTYVYRNSLLPADTLPSQIEHLLGMGAISEIGKVAQ